MTTTLNKAPRALKAAGLAALVAAGTLAGALAGAAPAAAEEKSPWMLRVRGVAVVPDEGASISPIGGDVSIDNSVIPELDITYFATQNIAFELILGTTKHDVRAKGTSVGGVDLGSVWLLPPTLTAQYHFIPDGKIRPYVGAGVNYTVFYNEDTPAGIDIDYDNGFGFALQAGVDFAIDDHWVANIDVKKLFLNTDVTINNSIKADVDIDPWLFGVGVGYRF
ncbi:OmpW family protein [Tistrella mobilis]|uniref:OmpW/AlkL family protein n=1 Tax=Tistrella mobilis TaxID=171437 RepID=UPI0031F61129